MERERMRLFLWKQEKTDRLDHMQNKIKIKMNILWNIAEYSIDYELK